MGWDVVGWDGTLWDGLGYYEKECHKTCRLVKFRLAMKVRRLDDWIG